MTVHKCYMNEIDNDKFVKITLKDGKKPYMAIVHCQWDACESEK